LTKYIRFFLFANEMYRFALIACLAVAALPQSIRATKCSDHLLALKANDWSNENDNSQSTYDSSLCTAVFSNFEKHVHHVHALVNEHLRQSLLYSMMSSHFEADFPNRLGFSKYMDELADQMWNDAVDLVKYAGVRGSTMAPLVDPSTATGLRVTNLDSGIGTWSEIEALGLALDRHQDIALKVHQLHSQTKDAALVQYLQNQFTGQHAARIRQLSGYLTNLVPMVQEAAGRDMALYFFDQSLA